MSDITYELKISPDKNSKQALLEFLLEQGRSDWVDCYDDLDIDDADSNKVIEELIETQCLALSLYSLNEADLLELRASIKKRFPHLKTQLKHYSSIVWNEPGRNLQLL